MKSKAKRYNKEQIIYALRKVEGVRKIAEMSGHGRVNMKAWESVN